MEPVIRGATTADIDRLVEMRSAFTFEDARPSDESVPFYCRHRFDVPGNPLIWETTEP